jgi:hypothetical protein
LRAKKIGWAVVARVSFGIYGFFSGSAGCGVFWSPIFGYWRLLSTAVFILNWMIHRQLAPREWTQEMPIDDSLFSTQFSAQSEDLAESDQRTSNQESSPGSPYSKKYGKEKRGGVTSYDIRMWHWTMNFQNDPKKITIIILRIIL